MAPEPTPLVHNAHTAIERAECALERGCMSDALDLLEQAVALEPPRARIWTRR
jgi:hypothetical protein